MAWLRTVLGALRLHQLAVKTAALTALAVAVVGALVVVLIGRLPWLGLAVLVVVAGLAAYTAVHTLVARRLELARATLRQARKRRFDVLARLQVPGDDRDELDALIWQVYRAGRVLQQEIERLERLENYRREFLGNVSHELKTPIFVISGFAEQLLDGALDDPRVNRRFVEKIGRNALRLDHLARDLMAISKIETGEMPMTMEPFDIGALIEETVEALEPLAAVKDVSVKARLAPGLPHVVGDREQLRQVVANLIDNAIKYNNEGGRIEVSARPLRPGDPAAQEAPAVRVTVVDDGIGIPKEEIPRLTERFYRVDRSRSRAEGGTGLGLAIVKHVLEAHGQRLQVESRPAYGSSFSFLLPAAATSSGDGAAPAALMRREAE